MANKVDPDQTAPIGAVCSGSTLFASILNSSVMLGNYLQLTTSAEDIFRCTFFLSALRVNLVQGESLCHMTKMEGNCFCWSGFHWPWLQNCHEGCLCIQYLTILN